MSDAAVIWLHTEEEHGEDWLTVRVLTDNGYEVGVLYFPMLAEYLEAGES